MKTSRRSLQDLLFKDMVLIGIGAAIIRLCLWVGYELLENVISPDPAGQPDPWQEELGEFVVMLGIEVATFPLLFWIMYRVARTATNPLRKIAEVAAAMGKGQLETRLDPQELPSGELARIGKELNAAFDRHEEARRKVADFTAHASHQLRTPLAAMIATAEGGVLDPSMDETNRKRFEDILQESQRLGRLLEQLLLMARMDRGLAAQQRTSFCLSKLARQVVEDFRPWMQENGMELTLNVPETAPFFGQENLLRELMANLLDNAGKSCPEGTRVRVSLEAGDAAGWRLTVEDSGKGFPDDLIKTVFSPFARGNHGYEGTGLGLTICNEISHLHGGSIEISHSKELGGASIIISLPATLPKT